MAGIDDLLAAVAYETRRLWRTPGRQRTPKSDQQTGAEALSRGGKAFGVDLGGTLPRQ